MLILNQFKGDNSCITEIILIKPDLHHCFMMICICFKFHEMLLNGFLVMAMDRQI